MRIDQKSPLLRRSLFLLAALALAGVIAMTVPQASAKKMPSFTLPSAADGKNIDSASYEGKVLLVTFFATWCPPCRMEVGILKQLHEEYKDKGFSVVALSVDQEGSDGVADFIRDEKINYPVLMATEKTTRDFGGIYGIPAAFLINQNGEFVKHYQGYVDHKVFVKDVQQVLK